MNERDYQKNESGLIGLLKVLWKRRWLIALGTAAATILTIFVVLLLPKVYQSKAVVSLSAIRDTERGWAKGLDIPKYLRYSNTFNNLYLFERFTKGEDFKEQWSFDTDFFSTHLKPIYVYDAEKARLRGIHNSILGIQVTVMDVLPGSAEKRAGILGKYVLTVVLNMHIGDYIELAGNQSQSEIAKINRAILRREFQIKDLKEKESLIENQLLKIPGIGKKTDRELVNANEKTEKYLSPQQQLVAVKMSIKETGIEIEGFLRDIKVNEMLLNYLSRVDKLFPPDKTFLVNKNLLETLLQTKDEFFSGKQDDESRIASLILTEAFLGFQKLQNVVFKFVSGPTLPERHVKPQRKRIVIAGFFLAFFIFVFLALLVEAWAGKS